MYGEGPHGIISEMILTSMLSFQFICFRIILPTLYLRLLTNGQRWSVSNAYHPCAAPLLELYLPYGRELLPKIFALGSEPRGGMKILNFANFEWHLAQHIRKDIPYRQTRSPWIRKPPVKWDQHSYRLLRMPSLNYPELLSTSWLLVSWSSPILEIFFS